MFLLWHHLFYNNPESYGNYVSFFKVDGIPLSAFISVLCKVCVSMFLILSGYGIHKSYTKYSSADGNKGLVSDLRFIKNRLLKLWAPFWIIYIIFVPLGLFFGRSFIEIYNSNPINYISDFFGLSFLVSREWMSNTMNATWWYMSIIIVFYLIYPLLHRLMNYSPELLLGSAVLLSFSRIELRSYALWIVPFILGMYASKRELFERVSRLISKGFLKIAVSLVFTVAIAMLRLMLKDNRMKIDFLFGFSIILLIFFGISKIPVLSKILEELGKKSGLIFMFHTFIYSYYFHGFIYSFKYPVLIFAVLLAISYCTAWIIQKLMDISRYSKLINNLTQSKKGG